MSKWNVRVAYRPSKLSEKEKESVVAATAEAPTAHEAMGVVIAEIKRKAPGVFVTRAEALPPGYRQPAYDRDSGAE